MQMLSAASWGSDMEITRDHVIEALAVTAQLYGREFSEKAAEMLVDDLADEDPERVLAALHRCRRELRAFPTVADIIARIDDGRPGANQAWALIPKDEDASCVWTQEMAQAWGVSRQLEDKVAARMAFIETYEKLVAEARARRIPPKWSASLGTDKAGQARALKDAVEKGRIGVDEAESLLPDLSFGSNVLMLPSPEPIPENREKVKELMALIRSMPAPEPQKDPALEEREAENRRRAELREQARKLDQP